MAVIAGPAVGLRTVSGRKDQRVALLGALFRVRTRPLAATVEEAREGLT